MNRPPSLATPIGKTLISTMTLEREIAQLAHDAGADRVGASLQDALTHIRACAALLIRAESERLNS